MDIRFGMTLRAIRTVNDLSVKEAAESLGVTSNQICDCESERKNLSINALEQLGEFYKFPCYKIFYVAELQTEKHLSFAQTLFEVLKCYQETKEEEPDKYAQFTSEKEIMKEVKMAKQLGMTLKAIRMANDMPIKSVAEGLGISGSYICDCENERKTPSIDLLKKFGEFYKFPCYKIFYVAELQTEKHLSFAQTLFEVLKCYQETKEEEPDKYAQFTSEKGL